MNKLLGSAALAVCAATVSPAAWTQGYPSKPITMIINQETGGPTSLFARALGPSAIPRPSSRNSSPRTARTAKRSPSLLACE